jgi:hypothetical protein
MNRRPVVDGDTEVYHWDTVVTENTASFSQLRKKLYATKG